MIVRTSAWGFSLLHSGQKPAQGEVILGESPAKPSVRRLTLLAAGLIALGIGAAASAVSFTNAAPIDIEDGPSVICGTVNGANSASITISDSLLPPTAASPYPSDILFPAEVGEPITDVNVVLHDFSHTSPDDVDVLLVGPNGHGIVLMSDVGNGNDTVNVDLTFDDAAATSLPDNGPLVSGTFKPTDVSPGTGTETYPSPGPAGPYGTALSDFNGLMAGGGWLLYVVDDNGLFAGSISGGWSLTMTATCPYSVASPYPSTIPVSGALSVSDADVTLHGFSHYGSPDHVDVLLVGPAGQKAMLMSDVGGGSSVSNLEITLNDEAASSLPDSGPLMAGTFKPTDVEADEPFPPPAPPGPYGSALSVFDGTLPNGDWRLYVVSDNPVSLGKIERGWTLVLAGPTSIAVRSVSARSVANGVSIGWRTAVEAEIAGFNLYRQAPGGKALKLNRSLIAARHSGSARGASYRFLDSNARHGVSSMYRLQLVSLGGARSYGGSVRLYTR